MSDNEQSDRGRIIVLGQYPPPTTGMAVAVEQLADLLDEDVDVIRLDEAVDRPRGGQYHLRRAARSMSLAGQLVRLRARCSTLYIACNAGAGMIYTMLLLVVARALRFEVYLHHHAYSYIGRRTRRFALLVRFGGPDVRHLVYCRCMGKDMHQRYPRTKHFELLSIAYCLPDPQRRPRRTTGELVYGHLSNLCAAKGLGRVRDTMQVLSRANPRVKLVLAGPPMTADEQPLLDQTLEQLSGVVDYRGPVSGERKQAFYDDIDVFLFPSLYDNESFALVVWEAMSAGRPVIAYRAGCLTSDAVGDGGVVLEADEDFVARASEILRGWTDDSASYERACEGAHAAARRVRQEALEQVGAFPSAVRRLGTMLSAEVNGT